MNKTPIPNPVLPVVRSEAGFVYNNDPRPDRFLVRLVTGKGKTLRDFADTMGEAKKRLARLVGLYPASDNYGIVDRATGEIHFGCTPREVEGSSEDNATIAERWEDRADL